jgi:hypothetical protein
MADDVTYYAIVDVGKNADDPIGLARRRVLDNGGIIDEALQRDLSWARSSAIVDWRRGDLSVKLVEVGNDEAEQISERLRGRTRNTD